MTDPIYQEKLDLFVMDLLDLIEKYQTDLPTYEIAYVLLSQGTSISLCCAPDQMTAFKTIISCIDIGLNQHTIENKN